MGGVSKILAAVLTGGASLVPQHKGIEKPAKKRKKKADQARIRALESKQTALAGKTVVGQGGSGSLLTGAGGLSDTALTGKQTLLAAQ